MHNHVTVQLRHETKPLFVTLVKTVRSMNSPLYL